MDDEELFFSEDEELEAEETVDLSPVDDDEDYDGDFGEEGNYSDD